MKHLRAYCNLLGIHTWRPILSTYTSFNYRRVSSICDCCGKVKTEKMKADHIVNILQTTNLVDHEAELQSLLQYEVQQSPA